MSCDDTIDGGKSIKLLFGGEDDVEVEAGNDLVRDNAAGDVLKGGDEHDQIDWFDGQDLSMAVQEMIRWSVLTDSDTTYRNIGDYFLHGGG